MGQSKSKSNIKYSRLSHCPSNPSKNTAEDDTDIEIGNLKKNGELETTKPQKVEPFTKAWYRGVMFATLSGNV